MKGSRVVQAVTLILVVLSLAASAYTYRVSKAESSKTADALRTGRIELVDGSGSVRIRLSADEMGGPKVSVLAKDGKEKVKLRVDERGKASVSVEGEGYSKAYMYSDEKGMPMVKVDDLLGNTRCLLALTDGWSPVFVLYDSAGKARTTVGRSSMVDRETGELLSKPESTITLTNSAGSVVWTSPDGQEVQQAGPPANTPPQGAAPQQQYQNQPQPGRDARYPDGVQRQQR